MAWVSPTGFVDLDSEWANEPHIYDNDFDTQGTNTIGGNSWGSFVELTISPISCDKLRFYCDWVSIGINEIDLDVYYGGGWHDVYQGSYADDEWVEKPLGGTYTVSAARAKFHAGVVGGAVYFREFEFNEVEAGEERLLTATCSASSSTTGSLILGKIESLTAMSASANQ
ncbi:hypothetical protein ES703_79140 [subsurface metagenome]